MNTTITKTNLSTTTAGDVPTEVYRVCSRGWHFKTTWKCQKCWPSLRSSSSSTGSTSAARTSFATVGSGSGQLRSPGWSSTSPTTTAGSCTSQTARGLSSSVRPSGSISRKWAVLSCMAVGSMLTALSDWTIPGSWESVSFSSWIHITTARILSIRFYRKRGCVGASLTRCSKREHSTTFVYPSSIDMHLVIWTKITKIMYHHFLSKNF